MKFPAAVLALFLAFGGQACAEPMKVVATFSIVGDMVREVGGDKVDVNVLVGPGGDAHVYQPTPSDAHALAEARAIVLNGLGMEGWLSRLIAASGTKAALIIASSGVTPMTMEEEHGPAGRRETVPDPHAWQDLRNGQLYARTIGEGLAAADPANAAYYRQRAADYATRLAALDDWVESEIAKVPPERRRIITSHDAFGYFGHAYGVTFLAPAGISTESEPSGAGMAKLIRQIRAEKIKALFIESITDPRLIQALAKETGAKIGGEVYSDTLSPAGGGADTYESMFRHNIPLFVAAMSGN